jgi:hypothetical protein
VGVWDGGRGERGVLSADLDERTWVWGKGTACRFISIRFDVCYTTKFQSKI